MSDIELVPFQFGHELEVTRGADGREYVVPKRICENLDLAWGPQHRKLSGDHRSSITMMVIDDAKGSSREICVIPLESLPWWLTSIDARKVLPGKREKLEAYQLHAAKVLYTYFMGGPKATSEQPKARIYQPDAESVGSPLAMMGEMLNVLQVVHAELIDKDRKILAVTALANEAKAQACEVAAGLERLARPIEAANRALNALPVSDVPAKPFTPRQKINARVQKWCQANRVEYREKWSQIYDHFNRRYRINLPARKKNDPEKYESCLDVAEDLDVCEDLFALVCELCPNQELQLA